METLTQKQKETLIFIQGFIEKNDYPPSIRIIMRKFKLKSTNSAWARIENLYKKKYLTKKKNTQGSMIITNNTEKQVIAFVKNFNPKLFNHPKRYKNLIEILVEYNQSLKVAIKNQLK